jgi:hypothetical protein
VDLGQAGAKAILCLWHMDQMDMIGYQDLAANRRTVCGGLFIE